MLSPKLYFMPYATLSSLQYGGVAVLRVVAGSSSMFGAFSEEFGVMDFLPSPIRPSNLVLTPLVLLVSARRNRDSAVGVGLHLKLGRSGERK